MAISFWPTFQSIVGIPSSSPPAQIVRDSQWTIVVADIIYSNASVELPAVAEIGDVVEIHSNPINFPHSIDIQPPAGQTILGPSTTSFRKISPTIWSAF